MTLSAPLEGTASAALAVGRVSYSHDAMIDMIIANPAISQNQLATAFGYTPAWVSRVKNSDAFQARLAARKNDIVDPSIAASHEERMMALAESSFTVVMDKLHLKKDEEFALKALDLANKALGYGARQANVAVQNNFVVALPQKAADQSEWARQYAASRMTAEGGAGGGQGERPPIDTQVVDVESKTASADVGGVTEVPAFTGVPLGQVA